MSSSYRKCGGGPYGGSASSFGLGYVQVQKEKFVLDFKKIGKKRLLSFIFVMAVLMYISTYLVCTYSEPYKKALEFSVSNSVVIDKLGKISSDRLGFYNFRISYGLHSGSAEFALVLFGEKKKGEIYFHLSSDASVGWLVRQAILDAGEEKLSILENL